MDFGYLYLLFCALFCLWVWFWIEFSVSNMDVSRKDVVNLVMMCGKIDG